MGFSGAIFPGKTVATPSGPTWWIFRAGPATPWTWPTDEFLSDIPAGALISFIALAPTDPVAGVADAPDVTFLAVSGAVCEAIVIVKWVTNAADSPLVAYIDSATGLPVTPNTGDIGIAWDSGANKIFKL